MRDFVLPAIGGVVGVLVSPALLRLFERLVTAVEDSIAGLAPAEALSGAIGLVVGLIVSFFVRDIFQGFNYLPHYGPLLSFVLYALITLFFSYLGVRVGLRQRLSSWTRATLHGGDAPAKLLDTSVIIDGRILEIVQSGFMDGRLLVPKFVLKELQSIADSVDTIKRSRGRRGLEILNHLREVSGNLEIYDHDAPERDVDGKLVTVARQLHAQILTNDYNLNRVARLQGITVLNINELANALKPVVLPGEDMSVAIVKDGKEQNQGIGYLEDGTMIVVENGRSLKGEQIGVQVTSVLQTAAGRMIFAKLKKQ
ncbi:MAG: PIN domain nuclease [Candidatus Eremiobacteraeota bacterium]|nr:PIN domain nuclease [Candidatus Eremiobacteraeota bacterium]MBC5826487.1 PIN domain nuclease [Candidatus Eremiobacteraeota bacterium]